MRIAVHQGSTATADTAVALAAADELARAAAARGAELLVLPQRFLGGDGRDAAAARAAAELSDGPAARRLAGIARARRLAILCGYVELCSGRVHDSALLVDAGGCALANYRRSHLLPGPDAATFARGQWLTVAPLGGTKVGVLIGADIEAPEPARALALAEARVLLVAARHAADAAIVGAAVLPTRAFETGCAIAYANAAAAAEAPRSRLVGPDGAVLAVAEDGLAVADVPVEPPEAAIRRALARRPRLYQKLAATVPGEDGPRL
jgi:predicted amidohydrolase